jgi:hypothetical protein
MVWHALCRSDLILLLFQSLPYEHDEPEQRKYPHQRQEPTKNFEEWVFERSGEDTEKGQMLPE